MDGARDSGSGSAAERCKKEYSVEFILYRVDRLQKSTRVPRVKTFLFRIVILPHVTWNNICDSDSILAYIIHHLPPHRLIIGSCLRSKHVFHFLQSAAFGFLEEQIYAYRHDDIQASVEQERVRSP